MNGFPKKTLPLSAVDKKITVDGLVAQSLNDDATNLSIAKSLAELHLFDHLRSAGSKECLLNGERRDGKFITSSYMIILKDMHVTPTELNSQMARKVKVLVDYQKQQHRETQRLLDQALSTVREIAENSQKYGGLLGNLARTPEQCIWDAGQMTSAAVQYNNSLLNDTMRAELELSQQEINIKAGSVLKTPIDGQVECFNCTNFINNLSCPDNCLFMGNKLAYMGLPTLLFFLVQSLAEQKGWTLDRTYNYCFDFFMINIKNPFHQKNYATNIYHKNNNPLFCVDDSPFHIKYVNELGTKYAMVTLFEDSGSGLELRVSSIVGYDSSSTNFYTAIPPNALFDEFTLTNYKEYPICLTDSPIFYELNKAMFLESGYILNSWFGGHKNLRNIDLTPLENQDVIFYIAPHSGLAREDHIRNALRIIYMLKDVPDIRLSVCQSSFFESSSLVKRLSLKVTPSAPNEFIKKCFSEGITVPEIPPPSTSIADFIKINTEQDFLQPFWGQSRVLHAFSEDQVRLAYFISLCSSAVLVPGECEGLVAQKSSVSIVFSDSRTEVMQTVIENSFPEKLTSTPKISIHQVSEGKIRSHIQTLHDYFKDSQSLVIVFLSEAFIVNEYEILLKSTKNFPEKRFLLVLESSNQEFIRKIKRRNPSTVIITEPSADGDLAEQFQEGDNVDVDSSCFDIVCSNKKMQAYRDGNKWIATNIGE